MTAAKIAMTAQQAAFYAAAIADLAQVAVEAAKTKAKADNEADKVTYYTKASTASPLSPHLPHPPSPCPRLHPAQIRRLDLKMKVFQTSRTARGL